MNGRSGSQEARRTRTGFWSWCGTTRGASGSRRPRRALNGPTRGRADCGGSASPRRSERKASPARSSIQRTGCGPPRRRACTAARRWTGPRSGSRRYARQARRPGAGGGPWRWGRTARFGRGARTGCWPAGAAVCGCTPVGTACWTTMSTRFCRWRARCWWPTIPAVG